MEPTSNRTWIGTALVVIALAGGGIFLFIQSAREPAGSVATSTSSLASSTLNLVGTHNVSGVTGTGDFSVELVPSAALPPAPDFRAPIVFSPTIGADVRAQIQSNADIFIGRIAKDPNDLRSWIDLGTMHKMGGDYKGAETIWLYVGKVAAKNSIAFQNLGDLYQNFLKDYLKAESNFLTAIKNTPNDTNPYRALFELYTSVYKTGTSAAENILKQGIQANPQSVDLQVMLARYYKSAGRTAEANAQYDAAIANAKSQGQTDLAAQIQSEK